MEQQQQTEEIKLKTIEDDLINTWKYAAIRAEHERKLIENELIRLRRELDKLNTELQRLRSPPLITGEILELLPGGKAIVHSTTGPNFLVTVAENVDVSKLKAGVRVALTRDNLCIVEVLPKYKDPMVLGAELIESPNVRYSDVGGLSEQINELKETVELPLVAPELFRKVGIEPPTGVLLIGPPGTGKTLLAKAVATETRATFIRLVASELVQKFLGEGCRLVRELFQLAHERAPAIIFIDEIDAIAARRLDSGTSAEREVQRTLMQLLAELDGFEPLNNVRVLGATNRPDILDPALLRPGRFDRIIRVPIPSYEARIAIFKIHTAKLNLTAEINIEDLATWTDGATGADIKAICMEAGMLAIRARKTQIELDNFREAINKVLARKTATRISIDIGGERQTSSSVMFL